MKPSKKVWLILGAVILVAALVSVYMVYFRQAEERDALNGRLSAAQASEEKLKDEKKNLNDDLAQAESLLNASQAQFPESVESIEYGEYLFEIAEDSNVNLASLNFPKPADKKAGAVTYSVVSLSLPVSGELSDIFDFIDILRTDERFDSTEVTGINMVMGGGETKATIKVNIYGYKG